MTMFIAVLFDILILAYFGSKVEIVSVIADCLFDRNGTKDIHTGKSKEVRHGPDRSVYSSTGWRSVSQKYSLIR